MMKPSLLLYIHGFNSSPQSLKANVMKTFCEQSRPDIKVITPQISCFPEDAKQLLLDIVEQYKDDYQIGLVGSSLGGYMSTWLNSLYGFSAVVVNPAVRPYELLQDYLGEQTNPYTNETYTLQQKHVEQLRSLDVVTLTDPADFWLLQQEGDEVLDYRQAVDKFSESKQTVEKGGDHSFVGFDRYPEQIINFLGL
ncbi:esterase YqiA [Vibrio algarum]|uniref:Esterase YqiA n=1 Tax=Vibrio algarum TaxID=3020714 RepID=A0ABT4YNI2_9VIBR|nr:esterase YqiA [Vibrio sp. KJ40-1]MDB1122970.1 esterase YqiA [Vibrio sp. KJ40-1]